jgi:adenosylmethionine-8-amino-7-oxononanoate aminotransferase
MDAPRVYPVSGGSEAVETALKLARAYHLARGDSGRHRVIGRWGSYHGNSRAALDVGGKEPLRRPYEPWLGQALHVTPPYEYRCDLPTHPKGCGAAHAEELDRAIVEAGPETVAAFIAEPVAGATLAAAVPPDDYWPAIAGVCRRHGVLLIADEVMTGFGRTGMWFGVDHWDVRPDILTAGKGAAAGYWPLGLCVASGNVHDTVVPKGFVHGFTYSHHAVGAAVGHAVLARLRDGGLVERGRELGERLLKDLTTALATSPHVGEVRGLGTMIGMELVRDRQTKEPFPRADKVTERVVAEAKQDGLLLYSSTGHLETGDGDLVMVGPPFTLTDDEADLLVERTATAIATLDE